MLGGGWRSVAALLASGAIAAAATAQSPAALEGYLNWNGALNNGALDPQLREQIALTVAQANRCIVTHALAVGRVKQYRVAGFGRDPHLTARTVLLKMHFVHSPKVNRGIEA